jgi:hypothetical protein
MVHRCTSHRIDTLRRYHHRQNFHKGGERSWLVSWSIVFSNKNIAVLVLDILKMAFASSFQRLTTHGVSIVACW